jgi:hypothetical protein
MLCVVGQPQSLLGEVTQVTVCKVPILPVAVPTIVQSQITIITITTTLKMTVPVTPLYRDDGLPDIGIISIGPNFIMQ